MGELLKSVAATLRFPEAGGDPVSFTAPPKVTVIRDSDGSKVLEAVEATAVEKEGADTFWTVDLTAAQLSELDVLTASWAGELEGGGDATFETTAEIVGGHVVSLAEIQKQYGEDEPKEEADIAEKRETAEREIEDACSVAFRPRYAKERLSGRGKDRLLLTRRGLQRVLSVDVDGVALSEAELEALTLEKKGVLVRPTVWPAGTDNIVVTYVHGITDPTAREPIREYAVFLLVPSPTDFAGRATSMSTEHGTFALVTPGRAGARFPLPSVNAFVNRFGKPLVG